MERMSSGPVFFHPFYGKVYQRPLAHHGEHSVPERRVAYLTGLLKGFSDGREVLSVDRKGFVGFPYPLAIQPNGAVLRHRMLARIVGARISQMQRGIFVISDTDQKHETVQLVQSADGGVIAENI